MLVGPLSSWTGSWTARHPNRDIDGDGDMDVVSGGKSGLFLAENVTRSPAPIGK
jgi:hypothetical protein